MWNQEGEREELGPEGRNGEQEMEREAKGRKRESEREGAVEGGGMCEGEAGRERRT